MDKINGLILAGGESARMGTDKSLLQFHGKSQRTHLHNLLLKFCHQVFLSCRTAENIPAHFNPLPDQFDFKSPLNGILSAFTYQPDVAWLSVPVDMPFLDEKIISHLIAERQKDKLATCFFDSDGKKPEPLFTLWESKSFPLLMAYYQTGKKQPRDFLRTHNVAVLPSPDPKMHINVNSPEDLQQYNIGKNHSL